MLRIRQLRKESSNVDIRIKTDLEARKTIRVDELANRGFCGNRLALALFVVALGGLLWDRYLALAVGVVFAADYISFVIRRIRTLRRYEGRKPRLVTPSDFATVNQAYERKGIEEPTMTKWHEIAGLGAVDDWRTALRYRVAASFYAGGTLIDVGCGDGRLCWQYHACPPSNYIGVDVGSGGLEIARRKTNGLAQTIQSVAEDTRLPTHSVDLVVCSECFEHLPEPAVALREFCRILKPGGRIVIQSPNAMRLRNLNPFHLLSLLVGYFIPAVLLRKVVHENTFIEAFTYHWDFTRQDFRKYLRDSPGLTLELIHGAIYRFNPLGSPPHRLLARLFRAPVLHWLGWDLIVVLRA